VLPAQDLGWVKAFYVEKVGLQALEPGFLRARDGQVGLAVGDGANQLFVYPARDRRALGVAALTDGSYLQAFTQLRGLFSEDGTPLHNYASYLGVADLAAAAVRADRRMEGRDVIEHALSRLDGRASARLEQLIARARGILAGPGGAASRHQLRDVIALTSTPAAAHGSN